MISIIDRKDLLTKYQNDNLFIEAGAGAGKTQFISDKVIDLILQGVSLKKIVLITFTKKAAEEMLGRISNNITKRIKEENAEEIKNKLLVAQKHLYQLTVSTIHSFCNKLINENSFAAEVSFNSTLLEDKDEDKRRNLYFSKWIETLQQLDYDKLHELAFFANPIVKVKEKYLELCNHLPEEQFIIETISEDEFLKRMNGVNELYLEIKKYDDGRFKMSASMKSFIENYEQFINLLSGHIYDKNKIIPSLASPIATIYLSKAIGLCTKSIKYSKTKATPSETSELETINNEIANKKKEHLLNYEQYYNAMLKIADRDINTYAMKAYKYFDSHFDRAEMSNNYIIYLTYKLLKSSSKIKNILADKYDVIIVDEFQDTDRFQISFIDALTEAIDNRKNKSDKKTTLVVVGDPKQSIYRFRGADINSFMNFGKKSAIKKEHLFLPQNYRSNNFIVNYLNDTFKKKNFCAKYSYNDMDYVKGNIIPSAVDANKKLAGVYSYEFNLYRDIYPKKKGEIMDASKNDPDDKKIRLARLIKYLKENKYQIYKKKKKTRNNEGDDTLKFRDITYSDFLIITHSKKDISDIANELNKLNIKTEVSGQFDMAASEIFNTIYSFLSYAFDNEKNNNLYLKSYFDLLWKTLSSKTNKSYDEEFKNFIDSFITDIKDMTPYGVLMHIIVNLLNKDILVSNYCDSDLNLYNSIVYELLENININTNCDAIHLLNEIDNLLSNMPEQQISLDEDIDAVRIMNVHKSKGLEGNIVIVFDSGGEASNNILESCDNKVYLSAKAYEATIDPIKLEKVQEKIRLEYVAMSRAKSVLIMEKMFSADSKFFAYKPEEEENLPLAHLQNYYDFNEVMLEPYHLKGSRLPSKQEVYKQFKPLTKDIIHNPAKLNFKDDAFKLNNLSDIIKPTISVFSPSSKENHNDECVTSTVKINRPKNNIFGDCLHRAMELLINDYDRDINDIANEAYIEKANDIDISQKDYYIKYLVLMIKAIKDLYDKMPDFKEYIKYPEYKFCSYIKESNELMNGSIDLLLIKDNHIKIIDYKSDIAGFIDHESFSKVLISRYFDQVKLYKKVVSNLYPKSNIDISIIYVEEKDDEEIAHEINIIDS